MADNSNASSYICADDGLIGYLRVFTDIYVGFNWWTQETDQNFGNPYGTHHPIPFFFFCTTTKSHDMSQLLTETKELQTFTELKKTLPAPQCYDDV